MSTAETKSAVRRLNFADWQPGEVVSTLSVEPISRATLSYFAGASGDHNPIHLDTDVAASAGLDDVFAQGMLSMAYLSRAVTDIVPQARVRRLGVRFTAITPVHGRPICTARVESIETQDGELTATLALDVRLEDGTTTLVGTALVRLD